MMELTHAHRAHVAVPYIGDATMLHMGHAGPFKVPGVARYPEGLSARVALEPRSASHAAWLES